MISTARPSVLAVLLGIACLLSATHTVRAGDSHAGYYYPETGSSEVYVSALNVMPSTSKRSRIGFLVGLNKQQIERGYAPRYHIFAKGFHAQKLIIVATSTTHYNTLYRLRALLASLTAQARNSPLFAQTRQPENLNFLDLARLAGFSQITISDGDKLAHRINLLSAN